MDAPSFLAPSDANTDRGVIKRVLQEQEIIRLNRLYAALSEVNQTVVRATSISDLLERVCRVIALRAEFRLVWIGECDETRQRVHILARAGEGQGFLEGLEISAKDGPEGNGPTGTAIRQGRGNVCNDFDTDPRIDPWRERTQAFNFHSAAAFPIRRHGRIWGSMTVYEAEKGFFRDKETALLTETADDIAFAISRLDEMAERKKTEEALRESEDKYRALIETTGTGYVFLDHEGKVRGANQEYIRLSGHTTLAEIMGRRVSEWTAEHDRDRNIREIALCLQHGSVRNLEIDYVDRAGKITPIEINATAVENSPSTLIISLCRDVSERKRVEEERRRLELQMLQAQKLESLGVMAGGIAHDFNNLLTVIQGQVCLVSDGLTEDSPAHANLWEIEKASARAAELCQQMLDYAGKGRTIVRKINLPQLVQDLTRLLNVSISKKVSLVCHLDEAVPAIEASPSQIRQVVMNLVINAAESIGEAEGIVTITTGVMDCDEAYLRRESPIDPPVPGRYAYVEVSDTGCGMDAVTQARIFDPFFTTKFTGRGLGLAAVLGIIRSHQGSLKLVSIRGQGTTFRVLLPVSQLQETAPLPDEPKATLTAPRSSGTILLVDDEDPVRTVTREVLKRCGFNVLVACDGLEAVECFKQHSAEISCVLLDMAMPRMNGEEAYEELRQIRPTVPIILASGFNSSDITNRIAMGTFTGFLQKPYQLQALRAKLHEVMSGTVSTQASQIG